MAPPFDLSPPGTAATRGWGRGWPADRRKDLAKVALDDVALWVHAGIAPLVAFLLEETERRGYRLVGPRQGPPAGWCWGYCNRAVRGTQSPSNHSWGLAVDLNAPKNPMSGKLITDMPGWMPGLWKDHGFRWGGDYGGRKDAMHFEFSGTPAHARALIIDLGRVPVLDRRPVLEIKPKEVVVAINAPACGMDTTPSGKGYWIFGADGGIFNYGDAQFFGSLGGAKLNAPIVGGKGTPTGRGYWMVAADGGVFAFGDAVSVGSMGSQHLNRPVTGMTAAPDGQGYWLVAGDGGIFAFGSAISLGSPA